MIDYPLVTVHKRLPRKAHVDDDLESNQCHTYYKLKLVTKYDDDCQLSYASPKRQQQCCLMKNQLKLNSQNFKKESSWQTQGVRIGIS